MKTTMPLLFGLLLLLAPGGAAASAATRASHASGTAPSMPPTRAVSCAAPF